MGAPVSTIAAILAAKRNVLPNVFDFMPTPVATPFLDESYKTAVIAIFAPMYVFQSSATAGLPKYRMKLASDPDSSAFDYSPNQYATYAPLVISKKYVILGEYGETDGEYVPYMGGTFAAPTAPTRVGGRLAIVHPKFGMIMPQLSDNGLRFTAAQRAKFGSALGLTAIQMVDNAVLGGNTPNFGIPLFDANGNTSTPAMQWLRTRYSSGGTVQIESTAHDPGNLTAEDTVVGVGALNYVTRAITYMAKVSPPDRLLALYKDGSDTPNVSKSPVTWPARASYPAASAYNASIFEAIAAPSFRGLTQCGMLVFNSAFVGTADDALNTWLAAVSSNFNKSVKYMRNATQSADWTVPAAMSDGAGYTYHGYNDSVGTILVERMNEATGAFDHKAYLGNGPVDDHGAPCIFVTPGGSLLTQASQHDQNDNTSFARFAGKDLTSVPLRWTPVTTAVPASADGVIPALGAGNKTTAYAQMLTYGGAIYSLHRINRVAWAFNKYLNDAVNGAADDQGQVPLFTNLVKAYMQSRFIGDEWVMVFNEHAAETPNNKMYLAVINMLTGEMRSNGVVLANINNLATLPLQPGNLSILANSPANGIVDPEDMADDASAFIYARGATSFGATTNFMLAIYTGGDRSVPTNYKKVIMSGGIGTNQDTPKDGFRFARYPSAPAGISVTVNRHNADGSSIVELWNATPAAVAAAVDGGTLAFTRTPIMSSSEVGRKLYKLASIRNASNNGIVDVGIGTYGDFYDIWHDLISLRAPV